MGGEAAHGALSDHIAEPAFWRCVKSCVNLGLIYVLWLPLPSAYGVYLPSALSRPAGLWLPRETPICCFAPTRNPAYNPP